MMSNTLKLRGAEPVIPGQALPEAFEALDSRLDATVQLCQLKGSPEAQLLGVVTVCQELQRLLKFAFIENGMLASRIEILTRYCTETVKKMEKKLADAELEHKATKKQLRRNRKRLSKYETLQRRRHQKWWNVSVSSSDYDTFTAMNRCSGIPDLEFMLRVNQIMIDFVEDHTRNELVLPPMGTEERAELSKLASVYKLRCRYGKALTLAPSTLIKARQAHTPAPGEVDAVLESFAKNYKRINVESGEKNEGDITEDKPSPQAQELPPSMLTPLSSATTVDMGYAPLATPAPTPPTSGLNTPTGGDPTGKSLAGNGRRLTRLAVSAKSFQSESPLPARASSSPLLKIDSLKTAPPPNTGGKGEPSNNPLGALLPPSSSLSQRGQQAQTRPSPPASFTAAAAAAAAVPQKLGGAGGAASTLSQARTAATPHSTAPHPTVVASPLIKPPLTPQPPSPLPPPGAAATEDDKETPLPYPPKRIRLTRKTAGLIDES